MIPVSDYETLLKKLSSYWSYKTIIDEAELEGVPLLFRYLSCTNRDRINAKLLELSD